MPAKRGRRAARAPRSRPPRTSRASETRLRPRPVRTPRHTIEDEPEPDPVGALAAVGDRARRAPAARGRRASAGAMRGAAAATSRSRRRPPPRRPRRHRPRRRARCRPRRPREAPTETPTPEPTVAAADREVRQAIQRHWRTIANGNYAAAYDRFAPKLQSAERARALDPGAAARRADRLRPRGRPADHLGRPPRPPASCGCGPTRPAAAATLWSGTYELRRIDGAWRISKAGLKSRKC